MDFLPISNNIQSPFIQSAYTASPYAGASGSYSQPPSNAGSAHRAAASPQDRASSANGAQASGSAGIIGKPPKASASGNTPVGEADSLSVDEDGVKEECRTCKNRKYKDGSDEMVSFKSPAHVSPEAAGTAVRAHEQEHVSNAYKKAAMEDGKVIRASVSIHMAVCPECGRSYVSGGTTHTQIKYYNEENPYQQNLKTADRIKYGGMNADYAV